MFTIKVPISLQFMRNWSHILGSLSREKLKKHYFLAEKCRDVTKAEVNVQRDESKKIRKFKEVGLPRTHSMYRRRWFIRYILKFIDNILKIHIPSNFKKNYDPSDVL